MRDSSLAGATLTLALALLLAPASAVLAAPDDGAIRPRDGGGFEAWDAEAGRWLDLEAFWLAYAARRGGLTFGRGSRYPEYDKVREGDTFMVEIDGQPCLMEFFHQRWRLANDVRRWDPAFDRFGACPRVFD